MTRMTSIERRRRRSEQGYLNLPLEVEFEEILKGKNLAPHFGEEDFAAII
jgi:hypothetical protein